MHEHHLAGRGLSRGRRKRLAVEGTERDADIRVGRRTCAACARGLNANLNEPLNAGLNGQRSWRPDPDRKSTRLNSSHANISYAVFCLKKKNKNTNKTTHGARTVSTPEHMSTL